MLHLISLLSGEIEQLVQTTIDDFALHKCDNSVNLRGSAATWFWFHGDLGIAEGQEAKR